MKKIKLSSEKIKKLNLILSKFTTYKNFSSNKNAAYKFSNLIGVKVCPYCNINYTYTVFSKRKHTVLRPDLDHFEAKTLMKSKQLLWSNLIPSCQQCNSRLKGKIEFTRNSHIHPYFEDFHSVKKFVIDLHDLNYLQENSFSIDLVNRKKSTINLNRKADNNIKVFKIVERYQYHKDEVVKILKKLKFVNKYRQNELELLTNTRNLLQTLFVGDFCIDINNVSLGKLKIDILESFIGTKKDNFD